MDNFNSAFLYGSSVFTTAKVERGLVIDWEMHLTRLLAGIQTYYFLNSTAKLAESLKVIDAPIDFTGAVRVSVFIKNPTSMDQKVAESDLSFDFNFRKITDFDRGPVVLKLVKRVQSTHLDTLKVGSYGKEIYLRKKAKEEGADDILFYGEGKIFETSVANIFFRKGDLIFTPKSGIYKGLTRQKLIEHSGVIEKDIKVSELSDFDEIFTASSLFDRVVVKEIINDD